MDFIEGMVCIVGCIEEWMRYKEEKYIKLRVEIKRIYKDCKVILKKLRGRGGGYCR